jgi:hypothetical protein
LFSNPHLPPRVDTALTRKRLNDDEGPSHEVASAPLHSDEVREKAKRFVTSLASRFTPPIFWLFEPGINSFEWPTLPRAGSSPGDPGDFDVAGFQAWLNPDAMLAAISREIYLLADNANALSVEERRAKEAEIRSEMLSIERFEEDLCIAEDAPRRPEADPRAVLGLSDNAPAPKDVP